MRILVSITALIVLLPNALGQRPPGTRQSAPGVSPPGDEATRAGGPVLTAAGASRGLGGPPNGPSGPPNGPSGPPNGPSGPSNGPSGSPNGPSGSPNGPSGSPNGPSGSPNGPSGSPNGPSGSPNGPSGSPNAPTGPLGSPSAPTDPRTPSDDPQLRSCLDSQTRTNPSIRQRYSDSLLRDICQHNLDWQNMVRNVSQDSSTSGARRPQFTQSQMSWLQTVVKCDNPSCVCETSPTSSRICANTKQTKDNRMNNVTRFLQPSQRRKRQTLQVDNTLQDRVGRAIRNEIRQLNDDDRNRYFRALNQLKFDQVDGISKYDLLVLYHTPEFAPEAHFSAALLPFHREMLKNFEIVLRMIDPGVSLPYWDTTLDAALPNPADSIIWTSDFFGNGFGDVINGPFANWFAVREGGRIRRNLGGTGSLMTEQDVQIVLGKQRFRNLVFCVDPFYETAHGATHMWVGGHMLTLRTSPNDPVFYNFHAFVDLIWEQWRWSRQSYNDRPNEYVNNNEACNGASTYNSLMRPFGITIGQGLSNRYTEVFYAYANRPQCPNCGSPYLFCDTRRNRCVSKVRPGGICSGYDGLDICYNSQCNNGRCSGRASNSPVSTSRNACRNSHACCVYWATVGECNRNAAWMNQNCRSACGLCTTSNVCDDSNARCSVWSAQGECQTNPLWMAANCQQSCNTCTTNFGASQCSSGLGGTNSVVRCRNNDNRCTRWANNGECTRNPDWMEPNCAQACNACS